MHSFKIIPEEELVVQILKGDITLEDFLSGMGHLTSDSRFNPAFSSVMDFRQGRVLMSLDDLKNAGERFREMDCCKGRRALLVNRSVDTAKILIFRCHTGAGERFSVYSTVEGASTFLLNDLSRFLEEDVVREDLYIDSQSGGTRSSDPLRDPSNLS